MKNKAAIEDLARKLGLLRIKDLRKQGLHPEQLQRLVKAGKMTRIDRGLYRLTDFEWGANDAFATVCKMQPEAIICLLSALFYHHIGTQSPHEIWIALPQGRCRPPRLETLTMRLFRFSEASLKSGVERIIVGGVEVKITTPARTVADCFKFRNKVGLDVALEALREGWQARRYTMDEILEQARLCRVEKVMQPYLETVVIM